ncbi:MAG: queuosine precursor transporter [Candidatus Nomurabacteria bacterium]
MEHLITNPKTAFIHRHKYLIFFALIWFSDWIINSMTSFKTFGMFGTLWSVGTLTYPITYILDDIFTEIYGYRISRKVIWSGFFCFFFMSLIAYLYSLIPGDPSFTHNNEFNFVFRSSPILVLTSLAAFSTGEFTNSFILAKMKIWTKGKYEGARYILSTLFGQTFDNTIFNLSGVLFLGWYSWSQFIPLTVTVVVFCTLWEILMLPITKRVIKIIKQKEGLDTYDIGTNFNPFSPKDFNY